MTDIEMHVPGWLINNDVVLSDEDYEAMKAGMSDAELKKLHPVRVIQHYIDHTIEYCTGEVVTIKQGYYLEVPMK